jgi:predicted thioesterase
MAVRVGLSGTASMTVSDDDTAIALRTGDVPVVATPRLAALAEEAAVRAVADQLEPGITTVGSRIQLGHLAPTLVGGRLRAEATLETLERRRLGFRVSISDEQGLVAVGRITRVLVERGQFLEKARPEAFRT